MKGSSVVLGFKSWTAKLHPPLPLDNKESHKLLASLKTSFRKQLDHAHPWPVDDGSSKATHTPDVALASKPKQRQRVPTASLADAHLAGVLSSPLMTTFGSRQESSQNTAENLSPVHPLSAPIVQLERSSSEGIDALAVASHCLQKFWGSVRPLSSEQRVSAIAQVQPGSRALRWLSSKGLHQSDEISGEQSLLAALVHFLDREGREDLVWSWMEPGQNPTQSPGHADTSQSTSSSIDAFHSQTKLWALRGSLLKYLVNAKLKPERPSADSTNLAMDIFFKACELSQTARWKPSALGNLRPVSRRLSFILETKPHGMPPADEQRWDRFLEAIPLFIITENHLMTTYTRSILRIYHPSRPDPHEALDMLKTLFSENRSSDAERLAYPYEHATPEKGRARLFKNLLDMATLLNAKQDFEQAAWVIDKAKQYFPTFAEQTDLRKFEPPRARKSPAPPATERDSYHSEILPPAFG